MRSRNGSPPSQNRPPPPTTAPPRSSTSGRSGGAQPQSGSTPSCRPSGASSASDAVFETSPTLGYDDVSEFVNTYGGVYVMLGAQDCRLGENGGLEPVPDAG